MSDHSIDSKEQLEQLRAEGRISEDEYQSLLAALETPKPQQSRRNDSGLDREGQEATTDLQPDPILASRLRVAAVVGIVLLALALPNLFVRVVAKQSNEIMGVFVLFFSAPAAAGSIYIILTLREMLNRCWNFHRIDKLITAIVVFQLLSVVFDLISLFAPKEFALVGILVLVPFGLLTLLIGLRLKELPDNLEGLRDPYRWVIIASGILMMTIMGAVLALITGIAGSVIEVLIFFQVARRIDNK